ncbi:phage tail protein I [Marinobacter sp. 1-3A]|uniref:phage tail protein I n=1 Tax=Marinobacter sp. 1-3A TaxID=2582920 RepID=UPI0019060BC7|nr:phage tail protein I [Marinobacter sp. 1-3A]MBK1874591.1 phage tail protein I [Marinobacter sp. 1-3A]
MSNQKQPLLPNNTTPLERAAAEALAEIQRVPVTLRQLWNPQTCPAHLLPYLAWAFSVDRWDPTWTEEAKREVIASSFYVHKKKGTISSLRRVIEPFGFVVKVDEWWQLQPEGLPGTFSLDISVQEQGITESTLQEMERLIIEAKPVSRHLTGLAIKLESRGHLYVGATEYSGDELTVYPLPPGPIEVSGNAYVGTGQYIIDTVSVNHG